MLPFLSCDAENNDRKDAACVDHARISIISMTIIPVQETYTSFQHFYGYCYYSPCKNKKDQHSARKKQNVNIQARQLR